MKLDWITDPHLDHLSSQEQLIRFVKELNGRDSDALLITGDIAESRTIYDYLGIVSGAYQRPVYFVLGNHDYYGGWMKATHEKVRSVCGAVPEGILNWMPDVGVQMLSSSTALVGHGGMYDGQEGTPGLEMSMSDFHMPSGNLDMVRALGYGTRHLFQLLLELGEMSGEHISRQVREAVKLGARRVVILTHVPPFLESSYFRGRPSAPTHAPFYVNKSLGHALLELSSKLPHIRLEVLAGHTHGLREHQAAENLFVRVGRARYGRLPVWQDPVVVGE
jgi:predicted phosphodiesterase